MKGRPLVFRLLFVSQSVADPSAVTEAVEVAAVVVLDRNRSNGSPHDLDLLVELHAERKLRTVVAK